LSLGDIEKRTDLLHGYISGVESGRTVPSLLSLEKFAFALEIPIDQLFYDGENPPGLLKLPNRMAAGDIVSGDTRIDGRLLADLRPLLSRIKECDRKLVASMLQQMARAKVELRIPYCNPLFV
jgi:transcriptional regulator with XRE-family HTH domain